MDAICTTLPMQSGTSCLLVKDFLNLSGFLLYFAGNFFGGAFGFKIGIVGSATGDFLELAFDFACLSSDSICSTFFHNWSSFHFFRASTPHTTSIFTLRTLTRDELQSFLDSKVSLPFSIVDNLRWDLREIF